MAKNKIIVKNKKSGFKTHQGYYVAGVMKSPTTGKRIARIEQNIRTIKNKEEVKYADEFSNFNCSQGGTAFTVNNIAGGNTAITRVGDDITMTSLQFKYAIACSASQLVSQVVRVMIVIDRLHNNSTSSFDGVPIDATGKGLLDNSVITDIRYMPRNLQNQPRYKVLYDKFHVCCPNSINTAATTSLQLEIHKTVNLKLNHNVRYAGAGGAVGDINRNALSIFVACSSPTTPPVFQYGARVFFKDS